MGTGAEGKAFDAAMDAAIDALTGPGGALEVARDARGCAIVAHLPATIGDLVRRAALRFGDRCAIVMGDERLGFAQVDALSERLAGMLAGRGIGKGDRVGIALRNAPAWVVAYLAVVKAGGIATLLNGWWTAPELGAALALTGPVLVIADAQRAARIAASGFAGEVVTLPIEGGIADALAPLAGRARERPPVGADDDATILFTSGSTGAAKGAVSTHRAVTSAAWTFCMMSMATARVHYPDGAPYPPVTLIGVPLFHVTGAVSLMLNSFALGRTMVLMCKWDAGEALRLIEAERVTHFVGVPTMGYEMMRHPDARTRDLTTLADLGAGGAARPVAHVPRLKAAFPGAHPMLGYGLTETNAVAATNLRAGYMAKPASTGRAQRPFVEIVVLDADGAALPQGATGEVGVRTAAAMRGYWDDPTATAAAFTRQGYLRTGDIGYLDEAGALFIVDRRKDIIIRGGENISCLEVESALYAHPTVAEAAVFGVAHERLGETVAAVVRIERGEAIDAAALRAFLGERLARYKLPAELRVVGEALPKLGTGKVDKRALRAGIGM